MSSQENLDSLPDDINTIRHKKVARDAGEETLSDRIKKDNERKRKAKEEKVKADESQSSIAREKEQDSEVHKDFSTEEIKTNPDLSEGNSVPKKTEEEKKVSKKEKDDDFEQTSDDSEENSESQQTDEGKEVFKKEKDDDSEESSGDSEQTPDDLKEESEPQQTDEGKEVFKEKKGNDSEESHRISVPNSDDSKKEETHPSTDDVSPNKPNPKDESPILLPKERFKNAKQDVPVEFEVKRVKVGDGEKLNWEKCQMDDSSKATEEEMGLSFDPDASILKVKPSKAGDFTIIFTRGLRYRLEYRLTVIADPRKLWDAKEPAKDSRYPKEHRDSEMLRIGERVLAGASIRGRSHARDGTHRDDDFIIRELADGWTLMVVADGAGSARFSREGSRILVETMHSFIKEQIDDENGLTVINEEAVAYIKGDAKIDQKNNLLINGALSSLKNIQKEAGEGEARTKDFNTTIISCLFKDFGEKTFIHSFCIGDGAIFAAEVETGRIMPLNAADSGEFAGQTVFLTTPQVWEDSKSLFGRIKTEVVSKPVGIISMTDGVSDPLLPDIEQIDDTKHTELLFNGREGEDPQKGLCSVLRLMVEKDDAKILEEWLDFYVAKHHDDRSIAVAFDLQFIS